MLTAPKSATLYRLYIYIKNHKISQTPQIDAVTFSAGKSSCAFAAPHGISVKAAQQRRREDDEDQVDDQREPKPNTE